MRPAFDLSLYLVLDPVLCGGAQGMVDTAVGAAANGATMIQLRAPQWKKRQWVECGLALMQALKPFHVPLIVDDQADVCVAINADGLHVGQEDLPAAMAREIIGPDRILGLSAGNLTEMRAANTAIVDYFGIGPVFSTQTKKDAGTALGIPAFTELMAEKTLPAVGIGGIKENNAVAVLQAGANGIAVVSAICGQCDPGASTAKLRLRIDSEFHTSSGNGSSSYQ